MTMMNNNLLFSAKNLSVDFTTDEGVIRAVDDISFSLEGGKTQPSGPIPYMDPKASTFIRARK